MAGKSCILVGNKADLARSRLVQTVEGCDLAVTHGVKFAETSPGMGHHIDELLFGLCGVSNKQTDLLDNSYYFHKGGCVSLSLPQPMYTVSLWHSWVGNARGGPCMNCSFRR